MANPWRALLDTNCPKCAAARRSTAKSLQSVRAGNYSVAASAAKETAKHVGGAMVIKAGNVKATFTRGR